MPFPFLALLHSVPETPSYGTELTLGAQNSLLGYATRFLDALRAQNRLLGYRINCWDTGALRNYLAVSGILDL